MYGTVQIPSTAISVLPGTIFYEIPFACERDAQVS